jgi:molybdenum cofactor guanylyltransferase
MSRPLTGILLVGGASSRFGAPKALAELDGERLVDRGRRVLAEACDEVLVVGKPGELPFDVVPDAADVRAPIAGVVAGLRAARHEVSVVLPVDCVRMTAAAVRALGAACRDAAVPPTGPLPGAWAKSALPALERRLAAGTYALYRAFEELDVAVVELAAGVLADVDTAEDLVAIRRRPAGYVGVMSRKQEDEKQRQAKIRAAKRDGKSPSAEGLTQGADKQIKHDTDPSHPKQKTTHPVRD